MEKKRRRKNRITLGGKMDWDQISGVTGTDEGYDEAVIKLKPRHYQAISFLLQGHSKIDVANELGVSKRAVQRWFKKGSICHEILCTRRHALWLASQQQLANLHSEAILEMSSLIHSDTEATRLKAACFILGNLKPETPVNLEELSEMDQKKYNELHRNEFRIAYYVQPKSGIIGDYTKYAIDPEDNVYKKDIEYPEDGFYEEEVDPTDEQYKKIELSLRQIKMITKKLNSAGVFTEKYMSGVVVRDKEGFVVGELHPSTSDRPSYARGDRDFHQTYSAILWEFFENRPSEFVTKRWRDAEGISHTEDLQPIIKMFIALGNVSIPERLEEDEVTLEPVIASMATNCIE